jgi:hypothetical protein
LEELPTFYFDRCVGTDIPEALRLLGMNNVYHHHIHRAKCGLPIESGRVKLFDHDTRDDEWMAFVGAKKWIVVSQDYSFHREPATLSVIKQHSAKVFYLWGADKPKIAVMRVLLRRFDSMVRVATSTPGPFIYRVKARGPFEQVAIK